MEDCIKVSSHEGGSAVFVDVEEDGSLLLETLKPQFGSSAIGLRYPFSGSYRSVRVKNGACEITMNKLLISSHHKL